MVLFGLISGRSTGTRLSALSWSSRKIWVTIWLPAGLFGDTDTTLPCSLPSASGTTLWMPPDSTTVYPCSRNAARNCPYATAGDCGLSLLRLMTPRTRGSTTTVRPVITPMVRATASISAPTKLSVMGSPGFWASAAPPRHRHHTPTRASDAARPSTP